MPAKKKSDTKGKMFFWGLGRRKTSVARVRLYPGAAGVEVNNKSLSDYIRCQDWEAEATEPLRTTEMADKFDILVLTNGGGPTGQAGAVRLGIARALIEFNSELRPKLKQLGFLTRDPREHERKKYGQKGARKRFQFSKR